MINDSNREALKKASNTTGNPPLPSNNTSSGLSTVPKENTLSILDFLKITDLKTAKAYLALMEVNSTLRDAVRDSVDLSEVRKFVGLCKTAINLNTTNHQVDPDKLNTQKLWLTHEDPSFRRMAKLVDIKLLMSKEYQNQHNSLLDLQDPEQLIEKAILKSADSFDEETLDVIKKRLSQGFLTSSEGLSIKDLLIADRLIEFVGEPASDFLDKFFSRASDYQLIEFAIDSSFETHTSAQREILTKIENSTFGQSSTDQRDITNLWINALQLIPILGEPARQFVLSKTDDIDHQQLAYHAVNPNIDTQVATDCQQRLENRLHSGEFDAGANTPELVRYLKMTDRFEDSASQFERQLATMPPLWRAEGIGPDDEAQFKDFLKNIAEQPGRFTGFEPSEGDENMGPTLPPPPPMPTRHGL